MVSKGQEQHSAEDEKRHRIQQTAQLIEECSISPAKRPQKSIDATADEGCVMNPTRRAQEQDRMKQQHRRGHDLQPGAVDPAAPSGRQQHRRRRRAACDATDHAVADLLDDELDGAAGRLRDDSTSAAASAIRSSGTQMPSLRPLSTFNPWRRSDGSRFSVTTA